MDFLAKAETFVRIVEAGSFSAAGRSLGLSLAAVSRQMAALESELDAKLLLRSTRSLHLTDEGRRFHEHANRLLRDADAARASVRPEGAIAGNVVVSASVSLGILRIVPSLPKLLAAHPGLELTLRLEDRSADLVSEGVDIAVRAGLELPDTTSLVGQSLASFARVLVASPGYLRRNGTPRSVAALAEHRAILGLDSGASWNFIEAGQKRAATMTAQLRVGTLLAVRSAALAGLGLAILPDFVVEKDLSERNLKPLLQNVEIAPVAAHALYRVENRGSPRIDAVIRHLRATVPMTRASAE
ncbi:MAG TPA: LysR family transcriptional regulator [Polyangiaceae bacterium]